MAGTFDPGPGWATGVGSLPGTDPDEAARLVLGELPDLPHLSELPGRGPGADLLGRGAGLLVGLPVDLQPSGWRLVDRPGRDARRAASYLSHDLDALEEAAEGYRGALKLAAAGPWTLAAGLRLTRGEPVLSDQGARRDLFASLVEGLAGHVADVARRVPGADLVLQLDEPSLVAVLRGGIRSSSGARSFEPVPEQLAETVLRAVVEAVPVPVAVHCCAADPPLDLMRRCGAAALSVDVGLLGPGSDEQLGVAVEAGLVLLAGLVPATEAPLSDERATVEPVRRLWHRLGLPAEGLATSVVVTPTCGLAGAGPAHARNAMRLARAAAAVLVDDPEG